MKILQFILLSLFIHTGVVIAGERFVWAEEGGSKVRFGTRIQQLKTWETYLLIIQCAMKNESTEVRFVPVYYADMHLRIPTVEYWLSVVPKGGDPFAALEVKIAPGGMERLSAVIEPKRYIRLGPGEEFKFSPVTVNMGNEPDWSKMSVTTRLKIDAPQPRTHAIEIKRTTSQSFEDSSVIDRLQVAVGEWKVQVPYEKRND